MGRLRPARAAAALLVAGAAACGPESDPVGYVARQSFDPPAGTYLLWWQDVEACSGRRGDVSRVRWYVAAWIAGGERVLGQWKEPHDITLLTSFELDPRVVKHEMLHDLLQGDGAHARPEWEVCGLTPP